MPSPISEERRLEILAYSTEVEILTLAQKIAAEQAQLDFLRQKLKRQMAELKKYKSTKKKRPQIKPATRTTLRYREIHLDLRVG